MRYVIFSVFLLVVAYAAATVVVKLIKCCGNRKMTPLSLDVSNVCKGIAILMVMLGHIGNRFGVSYLNPLGSWGVGIFLFLSGYGMEISVNKKGLQNFWRNRIITVWIPYAAAEIVGILICATPNYSKLTLLDIFKDLLLIKPIHPFGWYMQCLFLYYIGFYAAHKLFSNENSGKYVVLLVVAAAQFLLLRSLFKQQAFTFILGILAADRVKTMGKTTQKSVSDTLEIALGVVCLLIRQVAFVRALYWVNELIFAIQVAALTVGSVNVIEWLCARFRAVLFEIALYLGLISYEIYLYHGWLYRWIFSWPVSYLTITFFVLGAIIIAIPVYLARSRLVKYWKRELLE